MNIEQILNAAKSAKIITPGDRSYFHVRFCVKGDPLRLVLDLEDADYFSSYSIKDSDTEDSIKEAAKKLLYNEMLRREGIVLNMASFCGLTPVNYFKEALERAEKAQAALELKHKEDLEFEKRVHDAVTNAPIAANYISKYVNDKYPGYNFKVELRKQYVWKDYHTKEIKLGSVIIRNPRNETSTDWMEDYKTEKALKAYDEACELLIKKDSTYE